MEQKKRREREREREREVQSWTQNKMIPVIVMNVTLYCVL